MALRCVSALIADLPLRSLFKLAIPNFASRCLTVIIEGFAKGEAHGVLDSFEFRQNVFYFCFCTAGRQSYTQVHILVLKTYTIAIFRPLCGNPG
jgi:hypothetical protein